jgi:hypothetical protein
VKRTLRAARMFPRMTSYTTHSSYLVLAQRKEKTLAQLSAEARGDCRIGIEIQTRDNQKTSRILDERT